MNMAFYKDTYKKKKTRTERLNEGGWEDEGTRYHNKAAYGSGYKQNAGNLSAPHTAGGNANRSENPNQSAQRPVGGGNAGRFENQTQSRFGRNPQTARNTYARPAHPGSGPFDPALKSDRRAFSRPAQSGKDENRRPAAPDRNTRFNRPAQPERTSYAQPLQHADGSNRNRLDTNRPERRAFTRISPQPIKVDSLAIAPDHSFPNEPSAGQQAHIFSPGIAVNDRQADASSPLMDNLLSGRNPIREAIKSGRDIEKLLVARGDLSGSAREIISMAKEAHIIVQEVDRTRLDEITPHHQGMLAFASAYHYSTLEAILEEAEEKNEKPFLVILDGITDPHNLGAIIRTASCVGAHGVIIPERRAVGLTPAAVKAAAGSIEYIKVAKVTNITRMIEQLKERGIWIFAADQKGTDYRSVDFSGPCALVIGSEGEGISRLVLDHSDHRVSLPMRGEVDSLNASVAAGVLLYSILAKR
jgi:23S rRNA (guanosine2251-2'-O)-methyltransferase